MHFIGQRDDEHVILFVEKHWIRYLRVGYIFFIVGILPAILMYIVLNMMTISMQTFYYTMAVFFMYELFMLLYIFMEIVNDELDLFIITDRRIVDITQTGLLERHVADTPLENIQDVSASSKGLMETLFGYGTIRVQTAGKKTEFLMNLVPDPFGKSKKIMDLMRVYKELKDKTEATI